jgi:hypothetical protein
VITRQACITVGCDGCGESGDDCDGGVPHFATVEQARGFLDGWRIADDGGATCERCVARQACAGQGHVWDEWRDCRCDGLIGEHAAAGCDQSRFCERCHEHERRPAPAVAS